MGIQRWRAVLTHWEPTVWFWGAPTPDTRFQYRMVSTGIATLFVQAVAGRAEEPAFTWATRAVAVLVHPHSPQAAAPPAPQAHCGCLGGCIRAKRLLATHEASGGVLATGPAEGRRSAGQELEAGVSKAPQAVRTTAVETPRQMEVMVVRASRDHSGVTISADVVCGKEGY